MAVEIITKEDLQTFKSDLLTEIKNILLKSPSVTKQKEWLKSPEVRKLLSISPGTLQNLRVNGTIKYNKVGGIIYYKFEDIQKMLETSHKR